MKPQVQDSRVRQHSAERGHGTQALQAALELGSSTGCPQKPQAPLLLSFILWASVGVALGLGIRVCALVLSSVSLDMNYLQDCLEIPALMGFRPCGKLSSGVAPLAGIRG